MSMSVYIHIHMVRCKGRQIQAAKQTLKQPHEKPLDGQREGQVRESKKERKNRQSLAHMSQEHCTKSGTAEK